MSYLCCRLSVPSCGNFLKLHDSNVAPISCCWSFCIPYILSCQAGILEANAGRLRPPSPSWSACIVSQWRSRVETLAI